MKPIQIKGEDIDIVDVEDRGFGFGVITSIFLKPSIPLETMKAIGRGRVGYYYFKHTPNNSKVRIYTPQNGDNIV